jgi:hypothetical protein
MTLTGVRADLRRLPPILSSADMLQERVGFLGPNWFASVMGTGIVAKPARRSRSTSPVCIPSWWWSGSAPPRFSAF